MAEDLVMAAYLPLLGAVVAGGGAAVVDRLGDRGPRGAGVSLFVASRFGHSI